MEFNRTEAIEEWKQDLKNEIATLQSLIRERRIDLNVLTMQYQILNELPGQISGATLKEYSNRLGNLEFEIEEFLKSKQELNVILEHLETK
jgi:hypothetical protein